MTKLTKIKIVNKKNNYDEVNVEGEQQFESKENSKNSKEEDEEGHYNEEEEKI